MAHSLSAVSDPGENSPYSFSASDNSESPCPSPGDYTTLSQFRNNVAKASIESVCLFNDIDTISYPSHQVPELSPTPKIYTKTPIQNVLNYYRPTNMEIINIYTDKKGVVLWIVFPYPKKEVKIYTIRCDVHSLPPSALREDIKTVTTSVYIYLRNLADTRLTRWLAKSSLET